MSDEKTSAYKSVFNREPVPFELFGYNPPKVTFVLDLFFVFFQRRPCRDIVFGVIIG